MNPTGTNRRRRGSRKRELGLVCLALILESVLLAACAAAAEQAGAVATRPAARADPPGPTGSAAIAQSYSSDLYGFGLDLPSPWQTRPASAGWGSGVLEGRCPSDWDCFSDITAARTLAVAAIDVPQGTTLGSWQAQIRSSAPAGVKDADPPSATTLGGERALTWTAASVDEGVNVIKLVALHGTRAYVVLQVSPMATALAADQRVFDAIIGTFRFAAP